MILSFVVTTYNSSLHIDNCLKSISFQINNDFEIIVVDNDSTDNTVDISKKYTDKIYNKGPERSAQRNFGIQKAISNNIIFLDSDMILSPFFVESLVTSINKDNPLALYIHEEIIICNLFTKIRNHERSFYTATPIDCVRYINKKFFNEIGNFDENLTGPEDWDLNNRVLRSYNPSLLETNISLLNFDTLSQDEKDFYKKCSIDIDPKRIPCVYHDEREIKFLDYINKKSYYSKSFSRYLNKWGKDNFFVKKQLGILNRFIFIFFEKGKYKIFFKKLHLSLLVYILKFIVYSKYMLNRTKS